MKSKDKSSSNRKWRRECRGFEGRREYMKIFFMCVVRKKDEFSSILCCGCQTVLSSYLKFTITQFKGNQSAQLFRCKCRKGELYTIDPQIARV